MTNYRDLHFYRNLPERLTIGVSGGRSSAYQMAHIIAAYDGKIPDSWVFNFENTGLERPETYAFLEKLDKYFGLNLVYLEYDAVASHKVRVVSPESMGRAGEPMQRLLSEIVPKRRDGTAGVRPLPNPAQRTCTANLKIKTLHRYVKKHLGWPKEYYSATGYRADEPERYARRIKRQLKKPFDEGGDGVFPMYHAGVTSDRVGQFWRQMPFDLELDSDFGNCDLCFMASTWKIKQRMIHMALETQTKIRAGAPPPERVARWIGWEERLSDRPGPFRKDRPTVRERWEQVCAGDLESAVPEGREDKCEACTD